MKYKIKEKFILLLLTAVVLIISQELIDIVPDYYNDPCWENETDFNDSCYRKPCPDNFTEFDDLCYVLDPQSCPYLNPLPFDTIQNIARNISGAKLDVIKIEEYDYFRWQEIQGNYDKLFNQSVDGLYDQVAVDYTTENETYYLTVPPDDYTYNYVCAYYNFINNTRKTYCENFDQICSDRGRIDTRNCHCRYKTNAFFCEADCDGKQYNESICAECWTILDDYDSPEVTLYFSYARSIIFIEIKSYLRLLPLVDDNLVYCFTDAEHSLHDVIYRYDFSKDYITTYNDTYQYIYYFMYPRDYYLGHYWCKVFVINRDKLKSVRSDTIITPSNISTHSNFTSSFTMNITVTINATDLYPLTVHEHTREYIEEKVAEIDQIEEVHFLQLYPKDYTTNTTTIAYRLYTSGDEEEMLDILATVRSLFSDDDGINFSASFCLPEVTEMNGFNLTWPATLLGVTTVSEELCLQSNRQPVTRTCHGEYLFGTFWSEVEGTCELNSGELYGSKTTMALYNLTLSGVESGEKLKQLKQLIRSTSNPLVIDVHYAAIVFENVTRSQSNCSLKELIQVASDFMELDRKTLRRAQLKLNTTDRILYNVDFALVANNFWLDTKNGRNFDKRFFQLKTDNIYVQVSRIFEDNPITGAAFYDGDDIVPIYENNSDVRYLRVKDLKLAAFITSKEMNQLRDLLEADDVTMSSNDTKLVVVLYRKDSLFNDHYEPAITGYQVGFYVTGFEEPFLYDYVRILFKPNRKYRANLSCISWRYGISKIWYNQKGKWKREELPSEPVEDLVLCRYKHMTHYGILVNTEGSIALSIITAIGCVLSTLGSIGVIITAVIHRTWRENSGTKILLNFVVTILLVNCILAVSSSIDSYKEESVCIFIGALLHYCVGAQFTWMLIVGYLQYQRYVKIFFTVNTYFVIGASIVAWGLPIIPVITILIIDEEYYVQENYCYLVDNPLYFGVFLPVSVILTINIFIFSIILINVCSKTKSSINSHMRDSLSMLHLRLIILLFFLLGLYWIFGISARFLQSIALDYFFCITAALQGVVMFLYFIIFNKITKNFWLRQMRRSQVLASMEAWLQQKSKIDDVKLANNEVIKEKRRIQKIIRGESREKIM